MQFLHELIGGDLSLGFVDSFLLVGLVLVEVIIQKDTLGFFFLGFFFFGLFFNIILDLQVVLGSASVALTSTLLLVLVAIEIKE